MDVVREAFSYRDDPAVPPFPDDRPLIIFDGHCVLCSNFVQFILRHGHPLTGLIVRYVGWLGAPSKVAA